MAQCPAISDPGTVWPPYCPSLAPAYLFAVLFGLTLVAHIVQAVLYRKLYSLVIIVSALIQTGNFVVRILSINKPTNKTLYSDWFILMLVAPVWTNAFAYMVMGRMSYNFTPSASVFKVKAWRLGLIFVLLDIVAFFIQLAGLAIVGGSKHPNKATGGLHIYMLGIAFQQLCILVFLVLGFRLRKKIMELAPSQARTTGLRLVYVEFAAVALISVRIIFRLIEYANGLNSSIALHEVYEYIFDSTLMWIAIVIFNIFHPGRLMPGKDANWPSRKERKEMKKSGQAPHGRMENDGLLPLHENGSVGYQPVHLTEAHEGA